MSQASNRAQRRAGAHSRGRQPVACDCVECFSVDGVVYLVSGTVDRPVAMLAIGEGEELRDLIEGLHAAHQDVFGGGRL